MAIIAINCKITLNCINLFDAFLEPPLNKLAIPRIKTTATNSSRNIETILTKVPDNIVWYIH